MAHNKLITKFKRQTAVYLDHGLYNWLVEQAKAAGVSQSEIVRAALNAMRDINLLLMEKTA